MSLFELPEDEGILRPKAENSVPFAIRKPLTSLKQRYQKHGGVKNRKLVEFRLLATENQQGVIPARTNSGAAESSKTNLCPHKGLGHHWPFLGNQPKSQRKQQVKNHLRNAKMFHSKSLGYDGV